MMERLERQKRPGHNPDLSNTIISQCCMWLQTGSWTVIDYFLLTEATRSMQRLSEAVVINQKHQSCWKIIF